MKELEEQREEERLQQKLEAERIKQEVERKRQQQEEAKVLQSELDSRRELMGAELGSCLLYTSPSPRDRQKSRMPSSA